MHWTFALACLLVGGLGASGCSREPLPPADPGDTADPGSTLSQEGENCQKTADCALGLKCLQYVCTASTNECAELDCDDGNPCTDDACAEGACVWTSNSAECAAAACAGGVRAPARSCAGGACPEPDAGSPCADGYGCADATTCAGSCDDSLACADGWFCLDDSCAAERGDGEACAGDAQCQSDHCEGGTCCAAGVCCTADAPCDDANVCTDDVCDGFMCSSEENSAQCSEPICNAGSLTGPRFCSGGSCAEGGEVSNCPGGLVVCQDATSCKPGCTATVDCASGSWCDQGACSPAEEAGAGCTADEQCGSAHCQNGYCCDAGECCASDEDCDDANACTEDVCYESVCLSGSVEGACGASQCDGDVYWPTPSCLEGECVGPNESTDCAAGVPPCSLGICTSTGCTTEPVNGDECVVASCVGGQLTTGGTCEEGQCVPDDAQPCPGGFACASPTQCATTCEGDEHCAEGLGCQGGVCCPDGQVCCDTDDDCGDLSAPCVFAECTAGLCVASQLEDGEPCGEAHCEALVWVEPGECDGGSCVASEGELCEAGPCETSGCNEVDGCWVAPANEGLPCDDGDPCTSADHCAGGTCATETADYLASGPPLCGPPLGTPLDGVLSAAAFVQADITGSNLSQIIQVADATGFEGGDEVLIVLTKGDYAGEHELAYVFNVDTPSTVLVAEPVTLPLAAEYGPVLVRVAQFNDLEVSSVVAAAPGQLAALKVAGTLTITESGHLSADGAGFRGGPASQADGPDTYDCLYDGFVNVCQESTFVCSKHACPGVTGFGDDMTEFVCGAQPGSGGKGGYVGNGKEAGCAGGGGGGALVGVGHPGRVTGPWIVPAAGGDPVTAFDGVKLYLGAGGGSGAMSNGGCNVAASGAGGAGGGAIWIRAQHLVLEGRISADGVAGGDGHCTDDPPGCCEGSGAGGGGSGGSVYLLATSWVGDGEITARGGQGGAADADGGTGGDGGVYLDGAAFGGALITPRTPPGTMSAQCAVAGREQHHYRICRAGHTWSESAAICADAELALATPNDPLENTFLQSFVAATAPTQGLWIGYDGSGWAGETPDVASWCDGEPNGGPTWCGYLSEAYDGCWGDAPCSDDVRPALCEQD